MANTIKMMENTVDITATIATAFLPKFDPYNIGYEESEVCTARVSGCRACHGCVRPSYFSARRDINKSLVAVKGSGRLTHTCTTVSVVDDG